MGSSTGSLTIVGLGPGDPKHLTLEASDILSAANVLYVQTNNHFSLDSLRQRFDHLEIRFLDDIFDSSTSMQAGHGRVAAHLLELATAESVTFGLPGSAAASERVVGLLTSLAAARSLSVRVVPGLGYIEAISSAVSLYEADWLTILDALEISVSSSANALGESPNEHVYSAIKTPVTTSPVLITDLHSAAITRLVIDWLTRFWPEGHDVLLVRDAGTSRSRVEHHRLRCVPMEEIEGHDALVIPAISQTADVRTLDGLLNVTRALRAPGGCAWDREQTHDTLKTHLLEETYEVVEALDRHDYSGLAEELGDLMFQIAIHSQIAAEHHEFDIQDVLAGISSKLIRRHPHVFGNLNLPTSAAVLARWETLKQIEKPDRESILSSIPEAMPALQYSYAVQKRVAHQGFDWESIDDVLAKVDEELGELRQALSAQETHERVLEELGDLIFVLATVGRRLKLDPEEALRKSNRKFVERFKHVEQASKQSGKSLREFSPQELDALWRLAKTRVAV